jgi:signal transduction histidine kinase
MPDSVKTNAWVRLRNRLLAAARVQPPAAGAGAATPNTPAGPPAQEPQARESLVQELQRRMAQQDAALFYAKAALAAEIRERQTAEQELQRAMEQERFAVAGRLAAGAAHEINTPLQTVQTSLELMRSLPGEQHDVLLVDALEEIQRVGRIVRQLLDLYRPASEGAVDLSALVERVLLLLDKRIQDQRVEVRRTTAAVLPVHGRADELTQVVINLVVNALDVMPAGGVLTFRILPGDESLSHLALEIADTGPGVPPELRAQIFDPFVTTKAEGTGLGLAISCQIVERHRGKLTLGPPASGGSTFRVLLPVHVAAIDSEN